MVEEDEWVKAGARPVSAGSDDAADPWIAAGAKPADTPQSQTEPQSVPDAFVDRVAQGEMLRRETDRKVQEITKNFDKSRAVLKAFGEGFGDRPIGFTPESVQELRDLGMFRDPATGRGGPIRVFNEVALNSAAMALDFATRTAMGGIHAIGEMGGQIGERLGLPETEGLRREIRSYLEYEMQRGDHTFSRPHVTPDGQIVHQNIGTLPKAEDFQTAAKVLSAPAEYPVSAAIRVKGQVFTGATHAEAFEKATAAGISEDAIDRVRPRDLDAWVTNKGTFVPAKNPDAVGAKQDPVAMAFDRIRRSPSYDEAIADAQDDIAKSSDKAMRANLAKQVETLQGWKADGGPMPGIARTSASSPDVVEKNLRDLWTERGIHPAEAVHDAQSDAFLKHQIAPPSFTAFHGSPHEFDSFDTSRIGTGEGAQAYGHGLYFAESPETAASYQEKLSGSSAHLNIIDSGGPDSPELRAAKQVMETTMSLGKLTPFGRSTDAALLTVQQFSKAMENEGLDPAKVADIIKSGRLSYPTGHLYETTIHADKDSFLDWDKPLSEQTQAVKNALGFDLPEDTYREAQRYADELEDVYARLGNDRPENPADLKRAHELEDILERIDPKGFASLRIHNMAAGPETAAKLRAAGIPGIKYLDQGSRGALAGTRNYVVFDHNLVEVTKRDGVPLTPTELPPVRNSPMPEGTPRSELAKTGEPHIDQILDSPVTKRVVDNPVVDREHTVPYTAGGSVPLEDPTVFIDHRFPTSFTVDGVTFDPADPFVVHENVEQHVMENLIRGGMDAQTAYKVAHFEYAEKIEGAWYRAHGIDQAKAEAAYAPFMAQIQHEGEANTPPNLYTRPYPHDNPSAATHEPIAEPKPTKAEIAQAKKIMADQSSRADLGKSNIETAAASIARSGAQPYIGELRANAGENLDKIIPALQAGKNAQGRLKMVTQNLQQIASKLPDEQTVANALKSSEAVKAAIETKNPEIIGMAIDQLKSDIAEVFTETDKIYSVGADVTRPENLPPDIPPSIQRLQPAGRLVAAARESLNQMFDIGKDLQMKIAPMATGTRDTMAIAKDFANVMRRNRWEWSRYDSAIEREFAPGARKVMWDAADEESVMRQSGESSEHMGLARLSPREREVVEELQTRAQAAWLQARDLGMVEGEGLPAYTPRMVINTASALEGDRAIPLNGIGLNLRTRTAQMMRRKYLTAEETEAAAKAKLGEGAEIARDIRALPLATAKLEDAIAGRTLIENIKAYGRHTGEETVTEGAAPTGTPEKWFTLDHPAFKTWRPKLKDGEVVKDADGNTVFEQAPLYVRGDFEGPLRSVLTQRTGPAYGAMMALKGKTMGLIMNSPLIHNAVEWGRALPAMPGKVATFRVYFEGNRVKNDPAQMREAIDAGLVPIGKRFFNQDISSIMESPDLTPGRSWTAKVLGFVPGLFDAGAETAVRSAIDKAGDFWHNTMLWDRVADLQAGLYSNFRDHLIEKGVDRQTAARVAAHWANRYAGALPQEAMSDAARKVSNMLLFSRSFTMGNLGAMKDMLTGLPRDVMAQIERDAGFPAGSLSKAFEGGKEVPPEAAAVAKYTKTMARRKAMAVVALDVAMMYIGNSLLQSGINVLRGDNTLDQEMQGYADRFHAALQDVKENPMKLLFPLPFLSEGMDFASRVSSTSNNEPGKGDRIKIGNAADGTGIYMRNPVGKIGEEFTGYLTGPFDMIRRKLGTIARPAWQILSNDAGFGRKVYDPNADTPGKYLNNIGRIVQHLVGSQLPEGQINALSDLVKGDGDAKVNALSAFGPIGGVTFSKGAPGGPAVGEMYHAKAMHDYAVDAALPEIRKQIQRGDISGAQARMQELGIPPGLQRFYIKTSLNPSTRLGGRTLRDFYLYATESQKQRLENAGRDQNR